MDPDPSSFRVVEVLERHLPGRSTQDPSHVSFSGISTVLGAVVGTPTERERKGGSERHADEVRSSGPNYRERIAHTTAISGMPIWVANRLGSGIFRTKVTLPTTT
jgi:hypothetical protein